MKSNEQTELRSKTETDSESSLTALGWRFGGRGIEQKRKTHERGQQCGDCWGGDVGGGRRDYRGR